MSKQTSSNKKIIVSVITVVILLISAFFTYGPKHLWKTLIAGTNSNAPEISAVTDSDAAAQPLSVHYIDVGQGDCTLICFENHTILIDCGQASYADTVCDYLEALQIDALDLVIATHPDADHIGGFKDVLVKVKPALYLMPLLPDSIKRTQTELTLLNTLKTYKIKTQYAVNGAEYRFGDLILTTYLSENEHDNKNDYSIVTRIAYKNASYLFMGDAGKGVEKELMNAGTDLSADIFKAGHHGSSKSSGESFVKYVRPTVCVFSCGEGNDYGHPHKEVLQIMKRQNVKVLRTDESGTIVIGSDGEHYFTAVSETAA